jgi:hypothetical protein
MRVTPCHANLTQPTNFHESGGDPDSASELQAANISNNRVMISNIGIKQLSVISNKTEVHSRRVMWPIWDRVRRAAAYI